MEFLTAEKLINTREQIEARATTRVQSNASVYLSFRFCRNCCSDLVLVSGISARLSWRSGKLITVDN
jgi:hypothetical protein